MTEAHSTSMQTFVVAAILCSVALWLYNTRQIDAENLALGTKNQSAFESFGGKRITASKIDDIDALLLDHQVPADGVRVALWLGNSQLHTINQFKEGDHLAPYWLAEKSQCGGCLIPLGVSLPNANIQEHFVLMRSAIDRGVPVQLLILNLVFDDLREDGLRPGFSELITPNVRSEIGESQFGRDLLVGYGQGSASQSPESAGKSEALQGFVQEPIERWLEVRLSAVFPIWKDRGTLRSLFFNDLYEARNGLLGINPSTVRPVVKARYERNMQALKQILIDAKSNNVAVLLYVAPIRSDAPLPYPLDAYEAWKDEVLQLSEIYDVTLLNLEELVPAAYWGSYHDDDIDYMHFQGAGHVMVAGALMPELFRLIGDFDLQSDNQP